MWIEIEKDRMFFYKKLGKIDTINDVYQRASKRGEIRAIQSAK